MSGTGKVFLIVAGLLLIALGLASGFAGLILFRPTDQTTGIVASRSAVITVAAGALVVGVSLVIAGVTTLARNRSALRLGIAAAIAFVVWGFVGNYVLFTEPRLTHTGTNMVIAALIIWLLSKGRPALRHDPENFRQ